LTAETIITAYEAAANAHKQCEYAYKFCAGNYSYYALCASKTAVKALKPLLPEWYKEGDNKHNQRMLKAIMLQERKQQVLVA
jgi:hypothetical protein